MDTVDVAIPLAPDAAAALQDDPERRAAVGRLIDMVVQSHPSRDPLLDAMRDLSADAATRGLTAELLEAELALHKAERQR